MIEWKDVKLRNISNIVYNLGYYYILIRDYADSRLIRAWVRFKEGL